MTPTRTDLLASVSVLMTEAERLNDSAALHREIASVASGTATPFGQWADERCARACSLARVAGELQARANAMGGG